LKKGAKPNYFHRPEDQKNALHVAAENGYNDIVTLLYEHGAVIDSIAASSKSTAVMLATQNDFPETVKILIDLGANLQIGEFLLSAEHYHCFTFIKYSQLMATATQHCTKLATLALLKLPDTFCKQMIVL